MQEKQLELWNNLKSDNTLMQIQEYLEKVSKIKKLIRRLTIPS